MKSITVLILLTLTFTACGSTNFKYGSSLQEKGQLAQKNGDKIVLFECLVENSGSKIQVVEENQYITFLHPTIKIENDYFPESRFPKHKQLKYGKNTKKLLYLYHAYGNRFQHQWQELGIDKTNGDGFYRVNTFYSIDGKTHIDNEIKLTNCKEVKQNHFGDEIRSSVQYYFRHKDDCNSLMSIGTEQCEEA